MIRTNFIAAVSAMAIGFAGLSTASVQAEDNTAEILTGVAVFAIVGTIIANSKKDDHHHGHLVSRGHSPRYYGHNERKYHGHDRHRYNGHEAQKRKLYRIHNRKNRLKYKHHQSYDGYGHKRHYKAHRKSHHKKYYKY